MKYKANNHRYESIEYKRCGISGIKLPRVSLGLWHNFGGVDAYEESQKIILKAFDLGITHFDLANNYGPPAGSAEENFGRVLKKDLNPYRDELFISTKAGYYMWPGPYGEWGSRKYLISSLNQSLKRMGLEYVDLFYHHRPDPGTPLEETMQALDYAVRCGKAMYIGLSNYPAGEAEKAFEILKQLGTPCLIHQPRYSMLDRWVEDELLDVLNKHNVGCIPFSPLAQGILTNKYLEGIPIGSRANKRHGFLKEEHITPQVIKKVQELNNLATQRGQTLAQMALAWILKDERITSVLVGASSIKQLEDNIASTRNIVFNKDELLKIDAIIGK